MEVLKNIDLKKITIISLIIIFILMTVMSFSYGLSGDEVDMNEYGKAILHYFTSLGKDQTVFNMSKEYNRDGVILYYGGLFDLICAVVNSFSPFEEYTTRHILNAWAGFLAIYFSVKICIRCFGNQAAILCAWLMFLSPFFLGNAMNNPKDIPFAAAYIIAIYCIILLFSNMPKPKVIHYVWAILAIGAAINVRVAGILLIPYLFILAGFLYISGMFAKEHNVNIRQWIKPILIVAALGYLAGNLFWPYGQLNPFSNPLTALEEMSNFKVSILQLFDGEKIPSDELPDNYLLKSFIITNSYAIIAGIVLALFGILSIRKRPGSTITYFVFFTGLFPVFYIIYKHSNIYHLWRHVLFIFPSLAIMAAGGWQILSDWLKERKFKYGLVICMVLLLEPAYFIASSFPNTITYYNAFAGGVKGAYSNYEMDFYYNSLKQDAEWFKKNILPKYTPSDTIRVATNAAHLLNKYFKDNTNVMISYVRFPERNQSNWDYSIFHIALIPVEEIKAGTWLPPTTLFKATSAGRPLSAVAKRPSYDDIKGMKALENNNVDSALNYFDQYLKADPKDIQMLSIVANIYHQLHRDDLAQPYINKANQLMQEQED